MNLDDIGDVRPFPGPRPFSSQERSLLHGREREEDDLCDMVFTYQTVVLYAQSGAGKTSLINAGLQPRLTDEGWKVFRARPGGEAARIDEVITKVPTFNRFVYNSLRYSLEPILPPAALAGRTLSDAVDQNGNSPTLLIIDQLEEIFTRFPGDWKHRKPFFAQIRRAIETHPSFHVLFVIRDEYLALLDRYSSTIPGGFDIRYRLERLRQASAVEAIEKPLRSFGVPIESNEQELVKKIVVDLQTSVGASGEKVENEFIEPLELQIVCDRLWDKIREPKKLDLAESQLDDFADLSTAMRMYYDGVVAKTVHKTGVSESKLRRWCERKLISLGGSRNVVVLDNDDRMEIARDVVYQLRHQRLIQVEARGAREYCELSHDRFVDAVLRSNEEWEQKRWLPLPRKLLPRAFISISVLALVLGVSLAYKTYDDLRDARKAQQSLQESFRREEAAWARRLSDAEERRDEALATINKLQQDVAKKSRELDDKKHMLLGKQETLSKASKDYARLSLEIEGLDRERTTIAKQAGELVEQLAETRKRGDELTATLQATQTDFMKSRKELESAQHNFEVQVNSCKAQVDALSAQTAKLNDQLTEQQKVSASCERLKAVETCKRSALEAKFVTYTSAGASPPDFAACQGQ
jgi:predicted  nucleic acid-binding Zn-ribbon protein